MRMQTTINLLDTRLLLNCATFSVAEYLFFFFWVFTRTMLAFVTIDWIKYRLNYIIFSAK